MGYSYSAILNKNNRRNKTGKHTIFIRVTVDRQFKYFSLDERIEEKFWTGKENRWIKESHPFSFELNSIIKKKMDILHNRLMELQNISTKKQILTSSMSL